MYTRETAEKHIVDKVTFYSMVLIIFCMVSFSNLHFLIPPEVSACHSPQFDLHLKQCWPNHRLSLHSNPTWKPLRAYNAHRSTSSRLYKERQESSSPI